METDDQNPCRDPYQGLGIREAPNERETTLRRNQVHNPSASSSSLSQAYCFSPTEEDPDLLQYHKSTTTYTTRPSRSSEARFKMVYASESKPNEHTRFTSGPTSAIVARSSAQFFESSNSQTPNNTSPTRNSKFPFFTNLMGPKVPMPTQPPDEELLSLDIDAALFPTKTISDRNTFSPAAYKNLQLNATGLLRKFQSAYQHRTDELHSLREESQERLEEKDETETRLQHLKLQLETMARKAAEQEACMHDLMEALNYERKSRLEEQNSRETPKQSSTSSDTMTLSEDLGVEEDQRYRARRRRSNVTFKSEFSLDTDEESCEDMSIFSRSRSPTTVTTISECSLIETAGTIAPAKTIPSTPTVTPRQSPQSVPQLNTIQKLWKGLASPEQSTKMTDGCQNCQGQEASIAWDTVGLLRDENKALKSRIGDLEEAVEETLDVVNGIRV